jgi:hypothetical protein
MPYETAPLFLIPRGWRQMSAFVALSFVYFYTGKWGGPHEFYRDSAIAFGRAVVPLLYLPALLMVLRRPNEGTVRATVTEPGD